MKSFYLIIFLIFCIVLNAQQEYHVFPEDHKKKPGTSIGNGSLQNPWNLQTALNQSNSVVGGDIIWLHDGVYNGRFTSKLQSTNKDKFITVASFPNEWAILNGNIESAKTSVLNVKGANAIYKDFEITWIGDFSRKETDTDFQKSDGISHDRGTNCKFINLTIHNNPGSGFGSWKSTGYTEINNCFIYNNGFMSKRGRGSGVGIYVQNSSQQTKLIKNNTIFSNYYKGIEVWSANTNANEAYVKNITLQNNVIFNSGLVSGTYRDNLIIATDDRNGINIAKNINVENNILYHNTKLSKAIENNNASSLTLGFNKRAPIESIKVFNNIIIGRKDAIRILDVKSLHFKNNIVYSGYVRFRETTIKHIKPQNWQFSNNTYYTRNNKPIRVQGIKDYSIAEWNTKYGLDNHSNYKNFKEFNLNNVLNITKNEYKENQYRVVLFNKEEQDVVVDFSEYNLEEGSSYTIKDVENYNEVLTSGILNNDLEIVVPMSNLKSIKPHTLNNFGVYNIEFNKTEATVKVGFVGRFFKWLF